MRLRKRSLHAGNITGRHLVLLDQRAVEHHAITVLGADERRDGGRAAGAGPRLQQSQSVLADASLGHRRGQLGEPGAARLDHRDVPLVSVRASTVSGTFRKLMASTGPGKIPNRFLPFSDKSMWPAPWFQVSEPSSDS